MKVIRPINQNFPIWSFLCGDHALKHNVSFLSPKLIDDPDFMNPLENRLRFEIFKSRRGYILDGLDLSASFAVVRLTQKDLESAESPFTHVSFDEFISRYHRADMFRKGFKIRRKKWFKQDIRKSRINVRDLRDLGERIGKQLTQRGPVTVDEILDVNIRNETNLPVALNRGMITRRDGKLRVVDGTHRIGSWYWSRHVVGNNYLPDEIYAFYFESI